MSRFNTWAFKATGGRLGAKWRGGSNRFSAPPPVGILTTIGRKSGEPRESPLMFLREGNRVDPGRLAGRACHQSHVVLEHSGQPEITFQIKNEKLQLTARDATDAERDAVLAQARRDLPRLRQLPDIHRPQDPDPHLRPGLPLPRRHRSVVCQRRP